MGKRAYFTSLASMILAVLLVRALVIEAFRIPSTSMLPTLRPGDYILTNKLRYGVRIPFARGWFPAYASPRPGDVIVFKRPNERSDFVKRVVAVAGELVEIRAKRVFVDEKFRDVPSAYFVGGKGSWNPPAAPENFGPVRVPPGRLFVMGDNRDRSYDSRLWGFVDVDAVVGKASLIWWSVDPNGGWVRWDRVGKLIR